MLCVYDTRVVCCCHSGVLPPSLSHYSSREIITKLLSKPLEDTSQSESGASSPDIPLGELSATAHHLRDG
jgi:hypothetical protein